MLDWGLGGLWYYGWIGGRYWPNHWELVWQRTRLGLRAMKAEERFATTDKRYWPAVATLRPAPSVFIVLEPIELALEPDLSVFLSGFRVLAESPDYVIFDLTRRGGSTTARPSMSRQATTATVGPPKAFLHHFPRSWNGIRPGMTEARVLQTLGRPHRIVTRRDLSKPVKSWFYGRSDDRAIVFIKGRVFVKAGSY
jgi:hypothetical protein